VDSAGHGSYWGSPQYYAALKNADGYVFKVLEALGQAGIEDETLVLITADHGGYVSQGLVGLRVRIDGVLLVSLEYYFLCQIQKYSWSVGYGQH
ncbi:hypothetical protein FOZ62_014144, partial [Perkinsus olseni]